MSNTLTKEQIEELLYTATDDEVRAFDTFYAATFVRTGDGELSQAAAFIYLNNRRVLFGRRGVVR